MSKLEDGDLVTTRDNKIIQNAITRFAEQMKLKLIANQHKKHWAFCDIDYLLQRISEELVELENAIQNNESDEAVIKECADVANFAMFIADNITHGFRG